MKEMLQEQFLLLRKCFDDLIDAEDSGFEITTEGDSMSISNGEGLGRLDGEFHVFLV